MNKIIRKSNFTTVTNSFIRDKNISFKAKGVFVYMASMDSSWNFTLRSMANQSKEGISSITGSINELKEAGYITYEKHSDGKGTYTLHEKPKLENEVLAEPKSENPNLENLIMGKPDRIKKNNTIRKPINKNYNNNIIIKDEKKDLIVNFFNDDETVKAFEEYLILRKSMKLQNTDRVINRLMNKLSEFKSNGYSSIVIIENAITNGWKDFYEPKAQAKSFQQQDKDNVNKMVNNTIEAKEQGFNIWTGEVTNV